MKKAILIINNMMHTITIFKNFTKVIGHRTLEDIMEAITTGTYESQIKTIRETLLKKGKDKADILKKQLLAFTISGKFEGGRTLDKLIEYNPYIILDIDGLSKVEANNLSDKAAKIPFTQACFISPSAKGLKIIVEVNTLQKHHSYAYAQVANYYEQHLDVQIDRSGKDITRLCFLSHDPFAHYNPDSQIFPINTDHLPKQLDKKIQKQKVNLNTNANSTNFSLSGVEGNLKTILTYYNTYTNCLYHTQQKQAYQIGNRNNFIYQLACTCNRNGIPQNLALQFCQEDFDLDTQELEQAVHSAYKNNVEEFGKYPQEQLIPKTNNRKQLGKLSSPENIDSDHQETTIHELLKATPTLPDRVFDLLPFPFNKGCRSFPDARERDVFLTGALGVMSGCLPNVQGTYDRRVCYPNLFTFITAPAASGKGAMVFSKKLGNHYHKDLIERSKVELEKYKVEEGKYKMTLLDFKKNKRSDMPKAPEEPPFKVLFIPANSSSAMVIKHLKEAGAKGIMCETEADTMGNVLKQDWGGYSDLLRKCFHFEKISYSRKAEKEFVEIEQPQLSVAISGTPGQILRLIPSSEDGLFSRFLFYTYSMESIWRDVSPKSAIVNLDEYFHTLSQEVLQMTQFLAQYPTRVYLRDDQWAMLNQTFKRLLHQTIHLISIETQATIYRLGSICYRIAMMFSACRKFENGNTTHHLTCQDEDFMAALFLVEAYLEHAVMIFGLLPIPEQELISKLPSRKKSFYNSLPPKFKRQEAIQVGQTFQLSRSTVDRLLKQLIPKLLVSNEYGMYEKIDTMRK